MLVLEKKKIAPNSTTALVTKQILVKEAVKPTYVPNLTPRPQAKFVADVSLPDGSVVSPGASISKTWRLRNTGNIPWPAGSRIVHVGGDSLGLPAAGIAVDPVEPGHIVDVTVPLIAPSRPGRVVGYFRIMTADNQRFGHRIWIDLNVDGSLGEQIAASVAEPFFKIGQNIVSRVQEETMRLYPRVPPNTIDNVTAKEGNAAAAATVTATAVSSSNAVEDSICDEHTTKYEIELMSLCDMGFTDLKRNIQMLEQANGDLELSVFLLTNDISQ